MKNSLHSVILCFVLWCFLSSCTFEDSVSSLLPPKSSITFSSNGMSGFNLAQVSQVIDLLPKFGTAGYAAGQLDLKPSTRQNMLKLDVVLKYGADPTGLTDSTKAIQNAIDDAERAGGGTVLLPAGTFAVSLPTAESNAVLSVKSSHVLIQGSGTLSL
jgi:hypothetical protein